jgi:hypothetical protein
MQPPADARVTADRLTRPAFFLCIIARRTEARQIPLVFQMVASQFNCSFPSFLPSFLLSITHFIAPRKFLPTLENLLKTPFKCLWSCHVLILMNDPTKHYPLYTCEIFRRCWLFNIFCVKEVMKFIGHEVSGGKSDNCH